MSQQIIDQSDRALKAKHRAVWALGDYPAVATEVISELGEILVEAAGVAPGDRVLDVAAGAGNVAIPAALAGATVVASDLTPELLETGRRHAAARGAQVEWVEADAEALPFADEEFDVVLSCVGVMFAPHHQASADELVRVCRADGTIALISWTPQGFVGQMFGTMKPYLAPPPAGVQPPLWGDESHARELFGSRLTDIVVERRNLAVDRFSSAEAFREFFKANYGPTVAAYWGLQGDPEKTAALDHDLAELASRYLNGASEMSWEYLLFTGRKA